MEEDTDMGTNRKVTVKEEAYLTYWMDEAIQIMPYMRSILGRLVPVASDWLSTMAVDDKMRLYVNFEKMAEYDNPRVCAEALLHEAGHIFGRHFERAKDMHLAKNEAKISNFAGDADINDDLVEAGCSTLVDDIGCVLPEHFGEERHLTYEHYLKALRKLVDPDQNGGSGGSGEGDGESGEGERPRGEADLRGVVDDLVSGSGVHNLRRWCRMACLKVARPREHVKPLSPRAAAL